MQKFCFFSCFSFAYLFNILSIQGVDINLSSHHVFNETSDMAARQMFKKFVKTHNRTYVNDPEEYSKRLAVFKESLVRHAKLNARELQLNGTAVYGVNQFSDWTQQEFKEFLRRGSTTHHGVLTNSIEAFQPPICKPCNLKLNVTATPDTQDWSKIGKVTAVKNQGKCGSCWAFTATECVESQWAIANNPLTELSVQEFISCSRKKGCSGGNTYEALSWLQNEGYTLALASEFPYVDKETTCKTNLLKGQGVKIKCACLPNMVNITEQGYMKSLVGLHGPLGVNVDATMWHDYLGLITGTRSVSFRTELGNTVTQGGIIQHHCTDTDINHAVQITGYGFNGHIWYWIVRNSWGSSYGINGYLYIKMGDNLCGVADSPSYVVI